LFRVLREKRNRKIYVQSVDFFSKIKKEETKILKMIQNAKEEEERLASERRS